MDDLTRAGTASAGLQRKMCATPDLKFFGDESGSGSLSGYLSSFGNIDRGGEIVVRGAFSKHLDAFLKDGFIALNHDWSALPIATITEAHEDDFGLHFTADFHSHPAAQAARVTAMERIARGKSVSTSIGYKVLDSERTPDALLLKDLPLYEGSIVNVPMNALPSIGMVKGYDPDNPPPDADDAAGTVWSPPAGLSLADEWDAALAALSHAIDRKQAVIAMRTKDRKAGAVHSRAQVAAMTDTADAIEGHIAGLQGHVATIRGWCADAMPKSAPPAAVDEARRELNRFLQMQARYLGVSI